jgi:phosphoenolpyruvate carboxylase
VRVFGFHLSGLDMRQNSDVHEEVIAELFAWAGVHDDYVSLSEPERVEALKIVKSLRLATQMVMRGELSVSKIREKMLAVLAPLAVEYVTVVDREFRPLEDIEIGNTIILVEAVSGTTRLLDNIWI